MNTFFFFENQYFLHARFFLKSTFDSIVTWHSKHTSKQDLSEIKCTSSGNCGGLDIIIIMYYIDYAIACNPIRYDVIICARVSVL